MWIVNRANRWNEPSGLQSHRASSPWARNQPLWRGQKTGSQPATSGNAAVGGQRRDRRSLTILQQSGRKSSRGRRFAMNGFRQAALGSQQ
jgi:hypothetical protein